MCVNVNTKKIKCCMSFSVLATDLALGCCCPLQLFQLHRFDPLDHEAGRPCAY